MAQCVYSDDWVASNNYDAKISQARAIALAQGTNPIKALLYYNTPEVPNAKYSTPSPPEYFLCQNNGWLLKYANGTEVLGDNTNDTWTATDYGNPAYQTWVAVNRIKKWMTAHSPPVTAERLWDGVMLDNTMKPDNEFINYLYHDVMPKDNPTNPPINPRTLSPFTDQQTRDGLAGCMNAVFDAIGNDKIMLPNGINNGATWYNTQYNPPTGSSYGYRNTFSLVPRLNAVGSEFWLYHAYTSEWWSESQWKQNVDMLVEMQDFLLKGQPNRYFVGMVCIQPNQTKPPVPDSQILMFGYASMLLGAKYSGQNLMELGNTGDTATIWLEPMRTLIKKIRLTDMGEPLNTYSKQGNYLYIRDYTLGKVIANPTTTNTTFIADKNYTNFDGQPVPVGTSVAVDAHSGVLLFGSAVPNGTVTVTAFVGTQSVPATITIGSDSRTAPTSYTLPTGTYTVNATYQGQTANPQSVVVYANQDTAVVFYFAPQQQYGAISVTATMDGAPVGASVATDGFSGTTPVTWSQVPIGSHIVTATYQGQTASPKTVTVTANQTVSVAFTFSSAQTGSVTVTAFVGTQSVSAQVNMTGNYSGTTPVTWNAVPIGVVTVNATYQGQTLTQQPVVMANQMTSVVFYFQPQPTTITLNVIAGTGGSVSPSGQLTLTIGQSYTFTEYPNSNYTFNKWDLSGTNKGSTQTLTLTPDETMNGKTLTAYFTPINRRHVKINNGVKKTGGMEINGGGATNPVAGDYDYEYMSTVTITATPDATSKFDSWILDGNVVLDNPLPLLMDVDHTLTPYYIDAPIQAGFPLWLIPIGVVGAWYALRGKKHKK